MTSVSCDVTAQRTSTPSYPYEPSIASARESLGLGWPCAIFSESQQTLQLLSILSPRIPTDFKTVILSFYHYIEARSYCYTDLIQANCTIFQLAIFFTTTRRIFIMHLFTETEGNSEFCGPETAVVARGESRGQQRRLRGHKHTTFPRSQ